MKPNLQWIKCTISFCPLMQNKLSIIPQNLHLRKIVQSAPEVSSMYILNLWFGLRFGFFGRFKVRFENTNLGSEGTGSSRFGIFRFVPSLLEMVPLYIFKFQPPLLGCFCLFKIEVEGVSQNWRRLKPCVPASFCNNLRSRLLSFDVWGKRKKTFERWLKEGD